VGDPPNAEFSALVTSRMAAAVLSITWATPARSDNPVGSLTQFALQNLERAGYER